MKYIKQFFIIFLSFTLFHINFSLAGTMGTKEKIGDNDDPTPIIRKFDSSQEAADYPSALCPTRELSLWETLPNPLWTVIVTYVSCRPFNFLMLAPINHHFHEMMWDDYYQRKKDNIVLHPDALLAKAHNKHNGVITKLTISGRDLVPKHFQTLGMFQLLESLSFAGCDLHNQQMLAWMLKTLPNLQELDLSHSNLDDDDIILTAPYFSSLTALNLEKNSIGNQGALVLSGALTNLQHLKIWEPSIPYFSFHEIGFEVLLKSLSSLRSLRLCVRTNEGGKFFVNAYNHLSLLEDLHLYKNFERYVCNAGEGTVSSGYLAFPIDNEILNTISRQFVNLKSLKIWGFRGINSAIAASIATFCSQLNTLELWNIRRSCEAKHVEGIDYKGLEAIAQNLLSLTSLALPGHNIRDGGMGEWGDGGISVLVQHLTKLQTLNLMGQCWSIFDTEVLEIAQHLSNLTILGLPGCGDVGDQALSTIALHLPNLKTLFFNCFDTPVVFLAKGEDVIYTENKVGPVGLRALMRLPYLQKLRFCGRQIAALSPQHLKQFLHGYERIHGHVLQLSENSIREATDWCTDKGRWSSNETIRELRNEGYLTLLYFEQSAPNYAYGCFH